MGRGRKKKVNALNENISIRVTAEQKEVIKKNEWVKKEINDLVRNYLNYYVQ